MAPRQSVDIRREEILRAAVDQIILRGFANTRVVDVATSLKVSTALVFYHFSSKDKLLSEAFNYAAELDLARLEAIRTSKATARNRLRRILALYGPFTGEGQAWRLWIDAWGASLRVPELQLASRRLDGTWIDAIASVIDDGVEAGEFECADPHGAARRLSALLDGLAVQTTVHPGVVSRNTVLRWIRQAIAAELALDPDRLI